MIKGNKRVLNRRKIAIFSTILLVSIITLSAFYINAQAYEVKIDDKVLGITKSKESIDEIISSYKDSNEERYNKDVMLSKEITYEKIFLFGKKADSIETIKSEIEKAVDIYIEAFVISVDGEELVILEDKKSADKVLNMYKNSFLGQSEDRNITKINFVQDVKIDSKYVLPSVIFDVNSAYDLIASSPDKYMESRVHSKEMASSIMTALDVPEEDVSQASSEYNPDEIDIIQYRSTTKRGPIISVEMIEEVEYEEEIAYDVRYEEESSLYQGDRKIKDKGIPGVKQVKAEISYINGVEQNIKILEENIIQEPKTSVVLIGITPRPKTVAYGAFYDPTKGKGIISSRYGYRWGSLHSGVDIANPTGTVITAADGGKVVFSGNAGSYGKLVIIDHENGYQTYYAHCSQLLVSKGERVFRGQTIAKVGTTGRSTGPHVHFEVRKNGQTVDPLDYINR